MSKRIKYEDAIEAISLLAKYKKQLSEEIELIDKEIKQGELCLPDTILKRRVHISSRLFNIIQFRIHGHHHYRYDEPEKIITIRDASKISVSSLGSGKTVDEFKKLIIGAGLTLKP